MFICVVGLVLTSCQKKELPPDEEAITQLPEDTRSLFVEKGDTGAQIAILYCNGGPDTTLDTSYFDDLGLSNFHEVYVHQANTYNDELIIGLNENLSFERAIKEDSLSVEILYRVASYFEDQNKKIYIIGHSFGALIIPALMASKEIDAEKYLIMAGRLQMPDIVWKGFRDRKGYYFKAGITPTPFELNASFAEQEKKENYARMRLEAGLGKIRYLKMLENKMLNQVIFAYGENDQAVGRLMDEELSFLALKNAVTYRIPGGSHSSMFDFPHIEAIKSLMFDSSNNK
ncbi:MAG: hypothetical protein ACO3MZ_07355 [Flavobacteriaceae bacterium]